MISTELIEFTDAIADADERGVDKAILLGNGFSMDYDYQIFGYDSLAEEAALENLSVPKQDLFKQLQSTNFEIVVEKLRTAAGLVGFYGGDQQEFADLLMADAQVVQNGLADVLATRHPEHAYVLKDDEVQSARSFLSNFDRLFTLNYDLLLYWVVNRGIAGYPTPQADGFEWPTYIDRSKLIWKKQPRTQQNVFYLHGALHMYVEDRKVRKLSYNSDGRLVEGLRTRIEEGRYPLIVTEGTSEEKLARIDRSAYLRTTYGRFADLSGALFLHGVSMSPNDDHILDTMEAAQSQIEVLYIGVHDGLKSKGGRSLVARAETLLDQRKEAKGRNLRIYFYDSTSANVWRSPVIGGDV